MTFDAEALRHQIPYYLTADPAQKHLLEELKGLIAGAKRGYFIEPARDPFSKDVLQGDAWREFQIFSFKSSNVMAVRGIVVSNSCDIAPENERALPPNVTFAPIIRVSKIAARFSESGLNQGQVESRLQAIRSQSITSMFYLPADGPLDDEYVALLDDLHSMPADIHRRSAEKIFTLSMAGFYLFVFKLSVHFCRLHENVDRNQVVGTA